VVIVIVCGLIIFGYILTVNSSITSVSILAFYRSDSVALDGGFYYMPNAGGRCFGTLLSGASYQFYGLSGCFRGSNNF